MSFQTFSSISYIAEDFFKNVCGFVLFLEFCELQKLTQENRKCFKIVKEILQQRNENRIKKIPTCFLEQPFKCVKIIFSQIYLKTGRRKTQTRKVTSISYYYKYFIYFILFY